MDVSNNKNGVAAYCRSAVANSAFVASQISKVKEFAQNNGLGEVRCYCDNGCSGSDLVRPALMHLLHDVRAGKVKTVVVTDTARIARGPMWLSVVAETLAKYEAKLVPIFENRARFAV